ncbi:response regulator transcription factor [Dyadobacter sp. 32]|uniref:response regulator transcription factor n=1 Tax=Dyadobacter sp. 32 TaxID=538966 RepID=UPI0011ED978D
MKTLLIYDRQPIIRLGLKLLVEQHYPLANVHEIRSVKELSVFGAPGDVSVILFGLDPECERVNPRIFKRIKEKFSKSALVLYADNIHHFQVLSYFRQGITAYVAKRAGEEELLSCLLYVMDNKRYISSRVRDLLINDLNER